MRLTCSYRDTDHEKMPSRIEVTFHIAGSGEFAHSSRQADGQSGDSPAALTLPLSIIVHNVLIYAWSASKYLGMFQ